MSILLCRCHNRFTNLFGDGIRLARTERCIFGRRMRIVVAIRTASRCEQAADTKLIARLDHIFGSQNVDLHSTHITHHIHAHVHAHAYTKRERESETRNKCSVTLLQTVNKCHPINYSYLYLWKKKFCFGWYEQEYYFCFPPIRPAPSAPLQKN